MKHNHTKNITLCALFAAFMAVSAQLSIPLPSGVALTLQTFAVALCGATLGLKKGLIATSVYIFVGLVGIPVFSSFTGGIGALAGASGGFIIGFLPLCAFCAQWKTVETRLTESTKAAIGMILCYCLGVVWFHIVTGNDIFSALAISCAPYLVKDAIFIGAGLSIGKVLRQKI